MATHYRASGGFGRRFASQLGGVGGVAALFRYRGDNGQLEVHLNDSPDAASAPIRDVHERRGALRTLRNAAAVRAIVDAALAVNRASPNLAALDLRPGDIVVVNSRGEQSW